MKQFFSLNYKKGIRPGTSSHRITIVSVPVATPGRDQKKIMYFDVQCCRLPLCNVRRM